MVKFGDNYSKTGYGGYIKGGYAISNFELFLKSSYEKTDSINWGGLTFGAGYQF